MRRGGIFHRDGARELEADEKKQVPGGGQTPAEQGDAAAPNTGSPRPEQESYAWAREGGGDMARRQRIIKIVMICNALLAIGVVTILVIKPWAPATAVATNPAANDAPEPPAATQASDSSAKTRTRPAARVTPTAAPLRPQPLPQFADADVTLAEAQAAFDAGEYALAGRRFARLLKRLDHMEQTALVADLLRLRIGQCRIFLGRPDGAGALLQDAARSGSPVVRGMGEYQLAMQDVLGGQFLQARTRTYRAIASLMTARQLRTMEADCDFLIARVLTEEMLAARGERPVSWPPLRSHDPLAGLDETELMRRLSSGVKASPEARLGPVIEPVDNETHQRLDAHVLAAPVQRVLQRVATLTDSELVWRSVSTGARRRAVTLCEKNVSPLRLAEIAAGAAGLIAKFDGQRITLCDPHASDTLSDRTALVSSEAEAAWRRYFLRWPEHERRAEGQFALATLQEARGNDSAALREYRLVAHRHEGHPVAPWSLLRAAAIRIRLRDYGGARLDLLALLDRYPEFAEIDKAYLYLGESTARAGHLEEALRAYRRLYYLNRDDRTRLQACLGAARASHELNDPERTDQWATRYLGLCRNDGQELTEAYLLLGHSHVRRGELPGASRAFRLAVQSGGSEGRRIEALFALADVEARRERFVEALGAISELRELGLYGEHRLKQVFRTAAIYRRIGLPERAAAMLQKALGPNLSDEQKAEVHLAMAKSLNEAGEYLEARRVLEAAIGEMPPGRQSQEALCLLGEVCLELGRTQQSLALAESLLDGECISKLRPRARRLLRRCYLQDGRYDLAAASFAPEATNVPEVVE
jgi:tetratricopeptide (TPR) repeat protein